MKITVKKQKNKPRAHCAAHTNRRTQDKNGTNGLLFSFILCMYVLNMISKTH